MGFFHLTQDSGGRWRLIDHKGRPFFSIGINHVEEANLQHPHNMIIHDHRYPTRHDFISQNVARINSLGFNTLGWTQEYVVGEWNESANMMDNLHSAGWTQTELRDCGMPYMVALPLMAIEDWNAHPVYRDPRAKAFSEWCEYLARIICLVHEDSELCVGYFFVDIPGWARHPTPGMDFPSLVGLGNEQREKELHALADAYYSTACAAVRRADPNHLIFGDRYNGNTHDGNTRVPLGVLDAMKKHVDVLSVQYFCEPAGPTSRTKMLDDLRLWHEQCGKPVLIADIGNHCGTAMNPHRASELATQKDRGEDYVETLKGALKEKWCIGWHWCGYIESKGGRGWGIIDPFDELYEPMTDQIAAFNVAASQFTAQPGAHFVYP